MTAPAALNVTLYQGQNFDFAVGKPFLEEAEEVLTSSGMVTIPGTPADPTLYTFAAQFRSPDHKGRVEAGGLAVLTFETVSGYVWGRMSAAVTAQIQALKGTYDVEATYTPTGRTQKLYRGDWTLIPESTKEAP